jgi:hypothetical protein
MYLAQPGLAEGANPKVIRLALVIANTLFLCPAL